MYCRFLVDSLRPSDQIPDLDPHFYCNIRSCFSNGQNLRLKLTKGSKGGSAFPQPGFDASPVEQEFRDAFPFISAYTSPPGKKNNSIFWGKNDVGEGNQSTSVTPLLVRILLADLSDWAGVPSLPQCSMCIPLEASHSVEEDTIPGREGDGKLGQLNLCPFLSIRSRLLKWDLLTSWGL